MSDTAENEVDENVLMRIGNNPTMRDEAHLRGVRWATKLLSIKDATLGAEYLMNSCLGETASGAPALVQEMCSEVTRRRKFRVFNNDASIPTELMAPMAMTQVQLGNHAREGNPPICLLCHDVVLQVILDQWQIPGCYTVLKLVSLIADLDLHPNVIGLFLAFAYCNLASYSKACRIALLTSVLTVLRNLGVSENDDGFLRLQMILLVDQRKVARYVSVVDVDKNDLSTQWTTLVHWCIWVDGACREPLLSRLLTDSLLELMKLSKSFSYDTAKALMRDGCPEWQPSDGFLTALAERLFSPRVAPLPLRRTQKDEYAVENVLNWWQSQSVDYAREHVFGIKKPVILQQRHPKFTTPLPAPDFTLVVPSSGKKVFKAHSWIMIQWPFFARSISAGLAEAKDRVLELPSDMPLVVVEYILAVLYGADPLSSLDTCAVMKRMFPIGARFMLQNALLYELIAPEDRQSDAHDAACRFQNVNQFVCETLYTQLRQLDCSVTVGTPCTVKILAHDDAGLGNEEPDDEPSSDEEYYYM